MIWELIIKHLRVEFGEDRIYVPGRISGLSLAKSLTVRLGGVNITVSDRKSYARIWNNQASVQYSDPKFFDSLVSAIKSVVYSSP